MRAVLFHESRLPSRVVAFDYVGYFVTRRSRGEGPLCWEGLYFSVRFPLGSGFLFVELLKICHDQGCNDIRVVMATK